MKYRVLAPIVGIVCFLGAWELLVRLKDIRPFILRPPSKIVGHLADQPRLFLDAGWITLQHAYVGIAFALLAALLLGAPMAASRFFESSVSPVLTLVQVTPFVAYISTVVLWLGRGTRPTVFIVALVCLPAFAFAAVEGMRSADSASVELLASVDASRWEVLWRLRLPSAMPSLFTAARYNVGLALIAAYLVEGGNLRSEGLGKLGTSAAGESLEAGNRLWAVIFSMAILGTLSLLLISVLQRVLMRWHVSQRTQYR